MDDRVIIFDTTLRDGEQSPGASLNMEEKLEVARQLARLGVDVIEAGFPITSVDDFEAVDRVSHEIKGLTVCGLARCVRADIERAAQALQAAEKPRIHTFIGTSDIHMQYQLRKTPEEVLALTRESVRLARSFVKDVEFSPMDAGRTRPEFLYQVLQIAIEEGATTLNIPDTVGYLTPAEFGALIKGIRENVPDIEKAIISVHCHNDLGMATALSLAAVKEGARQVECTVNGIGERAGNAALEEVVMTLRTRKEYFNVTTSIDTSQIYKTSRLVSSLTGIMVQPNKAVVGSNAFAHESGIHQDGVLKEHSTFEIMQPGDIGLVQSALVLGKHSGRHALRLRLSEMGYNLEGSDLDRVFIRFKEVADKKKEVSERDLEAIVSDEVYTPVELVRLDQVQVTSGDHAIPTATVRMTDVDGHDAIGAATGTGPVDAIYRAINQVVRVPNRLVEYSVKSVTSGIDAIGEVTVRVEHEGRSYIGHGANTDIMVASARAYVNALNRLLAVKPKAQG